MEDALEIDIQLSEHGNESYICCGDSLDKHGSCGFGMDYGTMEEMRIFMKQTKVAQTP